MAVFQNTPGNNQQQGNKPQPSQQEQSRPLKEGSHAPEQQKSGLSKNRLSNKSAG
ncbi:hypothetical protein DR66_2594 [Delftia acidovorans]|uniref:hypothetical protein n=1 Tax=Delftia acidovorans TaxID=80866 RepID=UPI000501A98E|nr:hypothetical protein [Delftia acidovorans]KFJ10471.1 hypothetical protein DR66_2594 [Delftia acidovorans]